MSPETPSALKHHRPRGGHRRVLVAWLAGVALLASGTGVVWAFVHDGKSAAIEAAIPVLELEENPFLLREAWWNGAFKKAGDVQYVRHQLFKRNEYWFWLGASEPDTKVSLHIYDAEGKRVEVEAWQKGQVAAARIAPESTGSYILRLELKESPVKGEVEWGVIYAFR